MTPPARTSSSSLQTPADHRVLRGQVAVVAGGARGIGRGVAECLAQAGATVHVVDRDSREHSISQLPGTVEDTVDQIVCAGGEAVAHHVDCTDAAAVVGVAAAVRDRHGHVDVVVANAFDGNALPFTSGPLWDLPIDAWQHMLHAGVRNHCTVLRATAPLLMAADAGLLVLVGYQDPRGGDGVLGGNGYYDLAMHATTRLGQIAAHDFADSDVTTVVLSPGFIRTEAIIAATGDERPAGSASVALPGRAVVALASDPDRAAHDGQVAQLAALAEHYGFTDVDGMPGTDT